MRRKGAESWEEKEKKVQRKEESQMGIFAHVPRLKCIRFDSVRSNHLSFKMQYVRSSLYVFAPTGE